MKFFIAYCKPVGVYNDVIKAIIAALDEHGYCFNWCGPMIGGKWNGQAHWLVEGAVVTQHPEGHDCYSGRFQINASSLDQIYKAAKITGLTIEKLFQSGPRASWHDAHFEEIELSALQTA